MMEWWNEGMMAFAPTVVLARITHELGMVGAARSILRAKRRRGQTVLQPSLARRVSIT